MSKRVQTCPTVSTDAACKGCRRQAYLCRRHRMCLRPACQSSGSGTCPASSREGNGNKQVIVSHRDASLELRGCKWLQAVATQGRAVLLAVASLAYVCVSLAFRSRSCPFAALSSHLWRFSTIKKSRLHLPRILVTCWPCCSFSAFISFCPFYSSSGYRTCRSCPVAMAVCRCLPLCAGCMNRGEKGKT